MNTSAFQLAKVFAADVEKKFGVKPSVLNAEQSKKHFGVYGRTAVKAAVVYEGLGDGMIELTLSGKYMTGEFFMEPMNSYEICVYRR